MSPRACDAPQPETAPTRDASVVAISEARSRDALGVVPAATQRELHSLLAASAAGSESAFAELYDRTIDRIYAMVLRVLRAPDHTCEVNQEIYLEIWRRSANYDPGKGTVLTWMSMIAHHRAVDRVRMVTRASVLDTQVARLAYATDYDQVWDSVVVNLDAARVRRALAKLTPIQLEAVMLVYFGRRSPREIADHLRVPVATVKTRVRDGLLRLRTAMVPT